MNACFKNACRIFMHPLIYRYLIVNTEGRLNGFEKSERHKEMCQFYVAAHLGFPDIDSVDVCGESYTSVHASTQKLTDYMDEKIGFPIHGVPDYDNLAGKFFDIFHELAVEALSSENGNHSLMS